MCPVVAQLCPGIIGVGLPFGEVAGLYFRIFLSEQFIDFQCQFTGNVLTGPDRQFDVDTDLRVILCREEFRLDGRNQQHASSKDQSCTEYDCFAVAYRPVKETGVAMIQSIQGLFNRCEEQNVQTAFFRVLLE